MEKLLNEIGYAHSKVCSLNRKLRRKSRLRVNELSTEKQK